MEPHGFLSGKCKHGSSNFCTLCDIEGHPERYTDQLLADVIQEVKEYCKLPLSQRLQDKLLAYQAAKHGAQADGLCCPNRHIGEDHICENCGSVA